MIRYSLNLRSVRVWLWWMLVVVATVWGVDLVRRFPLDSAWLAQLEEISKILTPIAIGVGIWIAWRRAVAADRQADVARQSVEAALEGQLTERFTRAVEQLGDERRAVRVGGIYALERIARDSERDHWTVMEVLCTYVREESPESHQKRKPAEGKGDDETAVMKVASDIQAILTVLGRRNVAWDRREILPSQGRLETKLILDGTNLAGAYLAFANLGRVNFNRANLRDTVFNFADLRGVNLNEADLADGCLTGADLTQASLWRAHLCDARLDRANLQGACLERANLSGAILTGANLGGANLGGADLRRTDLGAANLSGANLSGANLSGANLSKARNTAREQINSARGDAKTKLPPDLERPAHWLKKE